MIDVHCPCGCGQVFHAEESQIGKKIRCPSSGYVLLIERPRPAPIARPEPTPIKVRASATPDINWKTQRGRGEAFRDRCRRVLVALKGFEIDRRVVGILAILAVTVLVLSVVAWWASRDDQSRAGSSSVASAVHPSSALRPSDAASAALSTAPKPIAPPASHQLQPTLPPLPPCAIGKRPDRPPNGTDIITPYPGTGDSAIRITNNGGEDMVVNVFDTQNSVSVRAAYVRAHHTVVVSNVEPSYYQLRWEAGVDWIWDCTDFTKGQDYGQLGKGKEVRDGYNYHAVLSPVVGGNTTRVPISRRAFLQGLQAAAPAR